MIIPTLPKHPLHPQTISPAPSLIPHPKSPIPHPTSPISHPTSPIPTFFSRALRVQSRASHSGWHVDTLARWNRCDGQHDKPRPKTIRVKKKLSALVSRLSTNKRLSKRCHVGTVTPLQLITWGPNRLQPANSYANLPTRKNTINFALPPVFLCSKEELSTLVSQLSTNKKVWSAAHDH